ncbi:hypothetical protein [Halobellus rarus]|uniref:C2H2-type domain-containing protein n=1 Tax=Halobellus rarus TaxID=1126237 RepID=A0ABD6CMG0_9EURY|nr:hypothetical protein [Halobellus rarus]
MPSKKFDLLSDREREFLKDPESFDPQTAADIRYRLRGKWQSAKPDMNLLFDNHEIWAKKETIGEVVIVCEDCGTAVVRDEYKYSHADENTHIETDEWINVINACMSYSEWSYHDIDEDLSEKLSSDTIEYLKSEYDYIYRHEGFCPDCSDEPEVIRASKRTGRVPCQLDRCDSKTHKIGSNPFEDHRNYIPLSDSAIKEIQRA